MTQAWAIMLLGRRLPEIDHWGAVADLYLVPAMDLPWQEDGTRLFGSELARAQFMDIAIGELDRRRLSWTWIEGEGDARVARDRKSVVAGKSVSGRVDLGGRRLIKKKKKKKRR